jgi:hypothetical protein
MINQVICQWLVLAMICVNLLTMLYVECQGRPARKPAGFSGVLGSLIVTAIVVWMYWMAGLFSRL